MNDAQVVGPGFTALYVRLALMNFTLGAPTLQSRLRLAKLLSYISLRFAELFIFGSSSIARKICAASNPVAPVSTIFSLEALSSGSSSAVRRASLKYVFRHREAIFVIRDWFKPLLSLKPNTEVIR